ncbi:uncharacterized protein LOC128194125 [Vigna angularis]|uniref:uncharacterized protein LOC128194125 n=1 Tax=Phaseolus angularis TaxID=3914 RepID=UPI0022B2FA2B|nr:uncharacterized protein LOC128194125 [Vigna angularis]
MDHSSAYGNFSFPYNAQPPRFDMFYEPIPEVFMQPANQAFQQQPPHCFQPYHEQPPLQVQQQLPHVYWDQYAEPEQENFLSEQPWQPSFFHYDAPEQEEFQSVQPWQDPLCDQQQGIPASELQGMTNQVAELVSAINKLTGRAKEEEGTPVAIEFQGFESQITSGIVSCTPQFYQDADQPWQPQFGESEQQDVYSPDCMAHMWKVATQLARESNEAQATIDDLKQLSTAPQQFDMQNVDLDSNCSDEFHCVHNSSCTISPALDLKSDFHSVNIDSVDLKEIVYPGCDVTSEFNGVESNYDFNSEPAEHAEFVTDSSLINMGLGVYAQADIVFDDLATEIKEDVDHESKSAVVVNEVECKLAENDSDEEVSEQIMQLCRM